MQNDYEDIEEESGTLLGHLAIRLILLALGFLLLFIAATQAFSFGKGLFYQEPMEEAPGTDIEIEITEKMDARTLAWLMKEKGLTDSELAIVVQSRLYQIEPEPGTYTLNTSMTPKQLLSSLAEQSETIRESTALKAEEAVLGGGDEAGGEEPSAQDNAGGGEPDGN